MPNPFLGIQTFDKYGYQDQLRRVFGGHDEFIDPYTTGYHYIYFWLPNKLSDQYAKFLTTTCTSVSIPGITVNPNEYQGLNASSWSYPGLVELDSKRFTCKVVEYAGLPILEIVGSWVNIFRNIIYGISDPDNGGTSQIDFKGRALYATTLFDGVTVQFAAAFTGIYPTKVPTDLYSSDVATHDKVEPELEFVFDQMYMGKNAVNSAQALVNSTRSGSITNIDQMYNVVTSTGGGGD